MPSGGISNGSRIPGETVQAIINHAAVGATINQIARKAGVQWHTAKAIIEREKQSIDDRKKQLQPIFARVAERGALRLEREIDNAPFAQAIIATGVAADKISSLAPPLLPESHQHLHLHAANLHHRDLAAEFNAWNSQLEAAVTAKAALPPEHQDKIDNVISLLLKAGPQPLKALEDTSAPVIDVPQ